jgi:hypothetical protein
MIARRERTLGHVGSASQIGASLTAWPIAPSSRTRRKSPVRRSSVCSGWDDTRNRPANCRRTAAACAKAFTGIDLIRRPDGEFRVLEANPSPMFAVIERRTATTAVTDALATSGGNSGGQRVTPGGAG